jgi:hypothetical protein
MHPRNFMVRECFSTELDWFLALLLASGLVKTDEIYKALSELAVDRSQDGALDAFCAHLVETGRITQWQREMLRNGQFRGFIYKDYRLMHKIGAGCGTLTFRATERSSGDCVTIQIHSPAIAPSGRCEHRVIERHTK